MNVAETEEISHSSRSRMAFACHLDSNFQSIYRVGVMFEDFPIQLQAFAP